MNGLDEKIEIPKVEPDKPFRIKQLSKTQAKIILTLIKEPYRYIVISKTSGGPIFLFSDRTWYTRRPRTDTIRALLRKRYLVGVFTKYYIPRWYVNPAIPKELLHELKVQSALGTIK